MLDQAHDYRWSSTWLAVPERYQDTARRSIAPTEVGLPVRIPTLTYPRDAAKKEDWTMRRLLTHRDARLYIIGQFASTFGDTSLWLAMGIWTKMLTGSNSDAGLSFFMLTLGTLAAPLGGVVADRMRRRHLLIIVNLATAALTLLLLLVHDRHQVWLIYAVMFGYGLAGSFMGPAQTALLQAILPSSLLGDANSMLQTSREGLRLITPLLGAGLLDVFGPGPVIVADAATFVIAIVTLLALRVEERLPARAPQHWLIEVTAGARHIRNTAALLQLTVGCTLAITAFGLSETTLFAVVSRGLHRPDAFLGVLVSAQGVGAVAAGATATWLMRRFHERILAGIGLGAATLGFLLQTTPSTAAVLTGSILIGASLPWVFVGVMTLFQRGTPPELMGRVDAALTLLVSIPQTVSIAIGAALVALINYRFILLAMAALMVLATTYVFTRPKQRDTSQSANDECHRAPAPSADTSQ